MTWHDKRMMALSQAGLVEKFVDALVWIIWPVALNQRGFSLPSIGWLVGIYGFTWGVMQLFTGHDPIFGDASVRTWLACGLVPFVVGQIDSTFWFVSLSMLVSGAWLALTPFDSPSKQPGKQP